MLEKIIKQMQDLIYESIFIDKKDLTAYFSEDFLTKNRLIAYPLVCTIRKSKAFPVYHVCELDNHGKYYFTAGITTKRVDFLKLEGYEELKSREYKMLKPNVVCKIPKNINYHRDVGLEPPSIFLYVNSELTVFGIIDTDLSLEYIAYKEEVMKKNFLLDLINWHKNFKSYLISIENIHLNYYLAEIEYYEKILKKQGFLK